MSYIQSMSVAHLSKLVQKAQEKTEREDFFQLYTAIYPYFDDKTKISFNDFIETFKPKNDSIYITEKTVDEIMDELLDRKE